MGRLSVLLIIAPLGLLLSCQPDVATTTGCVTADDCATGEACVRGACAEEVVVVLPPAPDGGVDIRTSCSVSDEAQRCGPGSYCDDDGFCDAVPSCDSGCPTGLECNDGTGFCFRTPTCEDCCTEGSCSDGRWCNGLETCDTASGSCTPADAPCGSLVCDETARACLCGGDGDCTAPDTCQDGSCSCTPDCTGRVCGDDGCGGSCGTCSGDGKNRGPRSQGHAYDDHRENHHTELERRFAQAVAERAAKLSKMTGATELVLCGAQRQLPILKQALEQQVQGARVEELAKNLSKLEPQPLHDHLAKEGLLPPRKAL